MADPVARDLVVHGRVQGVFFRAFVRAEERKLQDVDAELSAINAEIATLRARIEETAGDDLGAAAGS